MTRLRVFLFRLRALGRSRQIDRDLEELRAIDAALLRVADGSYGDCTVCDKPIDPKRLEITPQALRCIDCQTLFERTHFQRTGHTL